MILKLIIKDIKVYKNLIFLRIFLPMLIVSSTLYLRYYQWEAYVISACIIITVLYSVFLFSEKKPRHEILICSLPVKRSNIVIARYLTSVGLLGIGIILLYLNVYIAEFIYKNPSTHFNQINHLKLLFLTLFFVSAHLSIFLPAVFRLGLFGTVITNTCAVFTAILATVFIFQLHKGSFRASFVADGILRIIVPALFIALAPTVSAILSIKIYKSKEII